MRHSSGERFKALSDYIPLVHYSILRPAKKNMICSPDVVNGTEESGTVLLATSDEQVIPQRVELVSVRHDIQQSET